MGTGKLQVGLTPPCLNGQPVCFFGGGKSGRAMSLQYRPPGGGGYTCLTKVKISAALGGNEKLIQAFREECLAYFAEWLVNRDAIRAAQSGGGGGGGKKKPPKKATTVPTAYKVASASRKASPSASPTTRPVIKGEHKPAKPPSKQVETLRKKK